MSINEKAKQYGDAMAKLIILLIVFIGLTIVAGVGLYEDYKAQQACEVSTPGECCPQQYS